MTKFSNRIKKSSSSSIIILANDYNNKVPNLEGKTIQIGDVKIPVSVFGTIGMLLVINVFSLQLFWVRMSMQMSSMLRLNPWKGQVNGRLQQQCLAIISPSGMMIIQAMITSQVQSSFIVHNLQKNGNAEITNQDTKELRSHIDVQKNESVGPLQNPCDWAMKMFVMDSYHDSDSHSLDRWAVYIESEHCEWEGEPDDDNLWSCYYYNGETTEYDTWWQYCEHHLNESHWYCTDEFGEEASSPDNQNGTLYQPQEVPTTVNYDCLLYTSPSPRD